MSLLLLIVLRTASRCGAWPPVRPGGVRLLRDPAL